jgi:hypothetical protein
MATAGNFSALTVLAESNAGGIKIRNISALGPAAYATGGAELDLSSDSTDGLSNNYDAFAKVYCVLRCGAGAAADDQYLCTFVPGSSGAAATGKVKIRDADEAADAEVANAVDLSAVTFYFLVIGR